jgi:ubiquinone/menaquinone biosynthesis C-methylase UbiE
VPLKRETRPADIVTESTSPADRSKELVTLVRAYYDKKYHEVHTMPAFGQIEARMHKALESPRHGQSYPTLLELGVGGFEHFQFIEHAWSRYLAVDLYAPVPERMDYVQSRIAETGSKPPRSIEFILADALSLPLEEHSVDRTVATCLLLHLADPFSAVLEWQRVTKPTGVIDALVPCDPGFAVRFFRWAVAERAARKSGVNPSTYRLVNAADHVSSFPRVLELARAAVEPGRALSVRYYPFKFLRSWNVNGFAVFSIQPKREA